MVYHTKWADYSLIWAYNQVDCLLANISPNIGLICA